MSEDETRLRKSYSQQNEEENNMDIKTVFTEVWHAGWTFSKAMFFSFATGTPVGYNDPRVNSRVAPNPSDPIELEAENSFATSDSNGYDYQVYDVFNPANGIPVINPATGLPMADGIDSVDVYGNPYGSDMSYGWSHRHHG